MSGQTKKAEKGKVSPEVWERIKEQIEKVEFGSVTIVVHEGKVVQLDTNTKTRL